jgi:hypothetical protein
MNRYKEEFLDIDRSIRIRRDKIAKTDFNVAKLGHSQFIRSLEDAKETQKFNIHTRISKTLCSCSLSLDLNDKDSESADNDLVFRTLGHVDHSSGALTKVFVRKWPATGLNDDIYSLWCVHCGYLREIKRSSVRKRNFKIDHLCPKDALVQAVIKELKRSIIKSGTRPVVAGASSWNAAINKAILVIQEKAGL